MTDQPEDAEREVVAWQQAMLRQHAAPLPLNDEIRQVPAGETWTLQDERLRLLGLELAEAEQKVLAMRDRLNEAIATRRRHLRGPASVVCPVCGHLATLTLTHRVPDHRGPRGSQCRGSGLTKATVGYPMSGGL